MSYHNPPGGPHGFDMEATQRRQRELRERMRKDAKRWGIGFALWFAFCLLIGLGFLGLIVWAIIALVAHITSS